MDGLWGALHNQCSKLGWVESKGIEGDFGSVRAAARGGLAWQKGGEAGAGVAGDGEGLGRHRGTPAAQEEALGPGKGDGMSGGVWRSVRLTSIPGYPAGGKEKAFFSRSMPWAAVWCSHRYSGFGELLRPSKTGGKEEGGRSSPLAAWRWTGLGWIVLPSPVAARREAQRVLWKNLSSILAYLQKVHSAFRGFWGEPLGRTILYCVLSE